HFARTPRKHRQRSPELPFEVEDSGDEVADECTNGAVDVRLLAAAVAIGSDQPAAAIKANLLVRVAVSADFSGAGLHHAGQHRPRYSLTKSLSFAHPRTPAPH